jgi:hypothetical protein
MNVIHKLSVVLIAVSVVSCQKTTKRKLANEWNVDFYQEEYNFVQSNTINRETYENGQYNYVEISSGEFDTVFKGSVVSNTMTINTDGTWSSFIEYSAYNSNPNNPNPTLKVYKNTRSGTWNFAKGRKGDDFKKNELVYFNVTKLNYVEYNTSDPSDVDEANAELAPGILFETFRVIESKSKTLELKQEGYSQRYSNGDLELDRNSTFWYKLSKK